MKPAPFAYHVPRTVDEAIEMLADHEGDAAPLAGGQSLIPMMNMRAATPAQVVDLNRLPGLDRIADDGRSLSIGALVRHRDLENLTGGDPTSRLLASAARCVGSPAIRTRGTFVGSLAHADPAAEWCAVAVLLDGRVTLRSSEGARELPVAEFLVGPFQTQRAHIELVVGAVLRKLPSQHSVAFVEETRTGGDLPIACAGVSLLIIDGTIREAHIAVGGVGATAFRAVRSENALGAVDVRDGRAILSAAALVSDDGDPVPAPFASPDYRRHLGRVVVERAIYRAIGRRP
jgi:carbon-monoxide dehydrogenase medium subunit